MSSKNPNLARAESYVAQELSMLERYAEARELALASLSHFEDSLGKDNPEVREGLDKLAGALQPGLAGAA